METHDTLACLLRGGLVGLILGYSVRFVQDRKASHPSMGQRSSPRHRAEHGFMRIPLVQDFAVIIVVAVTAWAAFASNHAANEVQKTQDDQVVITTCTAEFLASTMEALNERTTFTKEQAEANVELQKAQAAYVGIFFQDPPPIPQQAMEALRKYFDKLTEFITINAKALAKVEQNPFPTVKGYNRCLHPDR